MVVHGSIRRGIAVVVAAAALAAGAVESAQAAVYENPHAPTFARVNDLLKRMTLAGEDRPDDAGRARLGHRRHDAGSRTLQPRLRCSRAAARCRRRTRRRRGPTWSTASSVPRWHAAAHPDHLRRRLRARRRQHLGATVFPHNIGLGATRDPALVRAGRARHGRGDAGHRPAVGLRAVHLRRARRPLGPHLRELRRGPAASSTQMETAIDGFQGQPGHLGRPRPRARDRQALRRRRRHRVRHRQDRRLQDRPGHRRSPTGRTSGTTRCASTSPAVQRPRRRHASCRRTRASTGPRTASATRSRCTATRS